MADQSLARIERDALFMVWAQTAALRGTCRRARVGAVIVNDGRPLAAGYVGSPPGQPHCLDVGCETIGDLPNCVRTVHAEANALAYAARKGLRVEGATLYSTHCPCRACSQLALSAGISRVVYASPYHADGSLILEASGIRVERLQLKPHEHPFMGWPDSDCLLCGQAQFFHT